MITLEPINKENVWKVCQLSVSEHQMDFVATNEQSIIEAYTVMIEGQVALPFAIKHGHDYVGFVMLGYGRVDEDDPEIAEGNYCLWRFMIDENHQGKGYGRKAIAVILDYIKTFPKGEANACWLSYEPENAVVKALYASFGFIETGDECDGETIAVLQL